MPEYSTYTQLLCVLGTGFTLEDNCDCPREHPLAWTLAVSTAARATASCAAPALRAPSSQLADQASHKKEKRRYYLEFLKRSQSSCNSTLNASLDFMQSNLASNLLAYMRARLLLCDAPLERWWCLFRAFRSANSACRPLRLV